MNLFKKQKQQDIENWKNHHTAPSEEAEDMVRKTPVKRLRNEKVVKGLKKLNPADEDFIDSVWRGQAALLKVLKQKRRRRNR